MSMFTVAHLSALLNLLSNERGSVEQFIRTMFEAEKVAIKEEQEKQIFLMAMRIIQKLVRPEDIVVTRPRVPCEYKHRPNEYQIRIWYKGYGHINNRGDVSDGKWWGGESESPYCSPEGYFLLAEAYSRKEQFRREGGLGDYPNHSEDFSTFFPGYRWLRQTKSFGSAEEEVDIFTLVKEG